MMRKTSGLSEDAPMMGASQEQKLMSVCAVFFLDWCHCSFYLSLLRYDKLLKRGAAHRRKDPDIR